MSTPNDPKRRALGKGLEALLPSRNPAPPPTPVAAAPTPSTGKPLEIPVEQIERNPFQTRTQFDEVKLAELTASVTATGVVQPIVVRPLPGGRFQLITGERRWLASLRAGRATVPSIVREVADEQAMEMTIVENLQRADLNPMEQAHAFQRLSADFQMTQEQMATRTGKDRASISNFLRLLKLPKTVQSLVESGGLSFGHARALLALMDSPEALDKAVAKIQAQHLSVRATEELVKAMISPESRMKAEVKVVVPQDPNVREAEDLLRRSLGLKVTIDDKKGKGKVIIEYGGVEDFDAILTALGRSEP